MALHVQSDKAAACAEAVRSGHFRSRRATLQCPAGIVQYMRAIRASRALRVIIMQQACAGNKRNKGQSLNPQP